MKKEVRETKKAVEAAAGRLGVTVEGPRLSGGGHLVWNLCRGGQSRKLFTPSTGSDRRGLRNILTKVRHLCAEMKAKEAA